MLEGDTMKVVAVVLAGFLSVSGSAFAQEFPSRPVRMLVGIGAGSSTDIVARVLGQALGEKWKQLVIIDNRGGSAGVLASDLLVKSAPDGHTLQFIATSFAINASVIRDLPFDTVRDFEPITKVGFRDNALVVSPAFPANSVRELIALAKAKPGQLTFGSGAGTGSGDHLAGELFKLVAGVEITHVPYKGPQVLTDVINGQITMFMGGLALSLPMVKAGKLKALAVTGNHRSAMLPSVPTFAEAGLPKFQPQPWYGLVGPRGTPKKVVARIAADVRQVLNTAEMKERFATLSTEPETMTPDEFRTFLRSEIERWGKVAKAAGL
jgi:tripartite-type tricarboxylate transporter receptor subunit TctC